MAESQNTIEDRVREQRMVGPTADQTNTGGRLDPN